MDAEGPRRVGGLHGRAGWRLALVGFGGLLLLTGCSLWAALTTNHAALEAARLTSLNDAFQRAHVAVTTERSLEHQYYVHRGPEVVARFEQAALSLTGALQFVRRYGDSYDQAPLAELSAEHDRYVRAVRRLFAALDAGDRQRALAISAQIEPLVQSMEDSVRLAADHERDETLAGLAALRRRVVATTPLLFLASGVGLAVVLAAMVGSHRRIERQAAQNQYLALHDTLTDLPNRSLLRDRTLQAIRQSERELVPAALLLIDLDRFKEVNDTLGHHDGDHLLVQVGQRLRGALRAVDTVARLGGDEFAVLLPRIETAEGATVVAAKLQAALAKPFVLAGLSLEVEASIGVAVYPDHGNDPDELLQHADIAMYVAKDTHSGFMVFDRKLDQHSPRRLALLGELRRAIERRHLVLHYQPKVDARSGRALGVEALVRWHHPTSGLIPPGEFVPLAERTGLITPLTHYVLDEAVHQCRGWLRAGHELQVAVNVSARRLLDHEFPDEVAATLAAWEVPARLLLVEITESAIMADPAHAIQVLGRLDAMGVQVAIDDFGTGYSSMAYLKSLPLHELKVDRSFVAQMTSNIRDAVIVRTTIDLGRNLGLRVVAEGVEDQPTWRELLALGCDAIQGYHVSRPVPPDELITWLQRQQAVRPTV
jgi:diguanylate cyclase (GGDEF)-like protein